MFLPSHIHALLFFVAFILGPSPGSSYPGVASKIGGLSVWESFAIDVGDASSLTTAVIAAQEEHDIDKAEGLLCGAVKILR